MDLEERRSLLNNLKLTRGAAAFEINVQKVLTALWDVGEPNGQERTIERNVFQMSMVRIRKYLERLERCSCVRLSYEGGYGNTSFISKITVLRNKVPPSGQGQKPVAMAQPVPAPCPKEEEKLPPHCLTFVDMPNLLHFVKTENDTLLHFANLYRIDWDRFRGVIERITHVPREHQTCRAYFKLPAKDRPLFEDAVRKLNRLYEIQTVVRTNGKDIDAMMDPQVVSESLRYFLCKEREVKIVMISGDSDRSFALTEVRKWAKMLKINLHIYVLAWERSLSENNRAGSLVEVADEVHHVETYLREFDPRGYELWKRHEQQQKLAAA